MSSTLPMIAIVSRNKFLGWAAVVFAIQSWLSETPAQKAKSATPGYFSVLMAIMSLGVVSDFLSQWKLAVDPDYFVHRATCHCFSLRKRIEEAVALRLLLQLLNSHLDLSLIENVSFPSHSLGVLPYIGREIWPPSKYHPFSRVFPLTDLLPSHHSSSNPHVIRLFAFIKPLGAYLR